MSKPEVKAGGGVYMLEWAEEHVRIRVDRLYEGSERVTGLITVEAGEGDRWVHLHQARMNLLSTSSRKGIALFLTSRRNGVDWDAVIEEMCVTVVKAQWEGEPLIRLGDEQVRKKLTYRIHPFLPEGQATHLYGTGGSLKTMLAIYLAVLMDAPLNACGFTTEPGNVLFLDYETSDEEIQERQQMLSRGLELGTDVNIQYRYCSQPLANDIASIQRIVNDHKINLVIIDSMGLACGGNPNDPEPVLRYYTALRALKGVTKLTIDHTNKEGRLFGCYSSDTEVLTRSGWKTHEALLPSEEVAAYDVKADCLRWEKLIALHAYPYRGNMIKVSHRSADILVTPNHRMFVADRYGIWQFVEAESLLRNQWVLKPQARMKRRGKGGRVPGRFQLRKGCKWLPMLPWLRFLGYFLSEGHLYKNTVQLSQTDNAVLNSMRGTLDALGFVYTDIRRKERPGWKPIHTLTLSTIAGERADVKSKHGREGALASWLRRNCGEIDVRKHLPTFVYSLPRSLQSELLWALIAGDGSRTNGDHYAYWTISPELADGVHALACLLGFSASTGSRLRHPEGRRQYHVLFKRTQRSTLLIRPSNTSEVAYDGMVYCLTVPSGAYLTRRNGKATIQGNSEYKHHASRSIWEAKTTQEEGGSVVKLGLFHRKMNRGPRSKPLGLAFCFEEDRILVSRQDVRDIPELAKGMSLQDQISGALQHGGMSVTDISEDLNVKDTVVRATLNRFRGSRFQRLTDNTWGLAARGQS